MAIKDTVEPLPTPLPDPTACYEHVRALIDATVRRFVRRYGGRYMDLRADADTSWHRGDVAYRNRATNGRAIDPDYRVEIYRWVWFELFDAYRVAAQLRRAVRVRVALEGDAVFDRPEPLPDFPLHTFVADLGADARAVVGLLFATTGPLCQPGRVIAATAAAKGGDPRNYRSSLRAYLAQCGWTVARINESFQEIREALA